MRNKFKLFLNFLYLFGFIFRIIRWKSLSRFFLFFLKHSIFRHKIPGFAILALTYKCQSRCVHCSAGLLKSKRSELDTEQWKRVLNDLTAMGVPRLHLSGGEPLLKDGIEEIVRYASSMGMVVFLETNGYLLDESTLWRLKKAGVSSIDISLDSVEPEVHDRLRGLKGSFVKAIEALKLCSKLNIPCMISTYVTHERILSGDIQKLFLLGKQLNASVIRILLPQPSGRWLIDPPAKLDRADKMRLRSSFINFPVLDRTDTPICPVKRRYAIFIGPDGEMGFCSHVPVSFGSVLDESIEHILDRMGNSPLFSDNLGCYVSNSDFRSKYILPALESGKDFPVRF